MSRAGVVSRRRLLGAAGAVGLGTLLTGAAACGRTDDAGRPRPGPGRTASTSPGATAAPTPTASTPPATPTATRSARASTPGANDWRALGSDLAGRVYRPGDDAFARAHQLYDPRFDAIAPPAVVSAATEQDVAVAVDFARRFGLSMVARSGGHSYVGASTSDRGLVVDLRALDEVSVDDGYARIGPGALLGSVYAGLRQRGLVIPAGTCPTVGIAGHALGGGVGLATRAYGLTADALRSLRIVTADGTIREVDAGHEPELFWACRGGGGGTAGVATRFVLRTWPTPDIGEFRAVWRWRHASAVVEAWQRWIAGGTASDRVPTDTVWANLHLEAHPNGEQSVSIFGVAFDNDPERWLSSLVRNVGFEPISHYAYADRHIGPLGGTARTVFYAGSDVLGGPLPASSISRVLATVDRAADARLDAAAILDPLGGAVRRVGGGSTAFPWRSALCTVQWYAEPGAGGRAAAGRWVSSAHASLAGRSLGAYVNYLEPARPDGRAYFGANTPRLRAVRARYDPTGLFRPPYRI